MLRINRKERERGPRGGRGLKRYLLAALLTFPLLQTGTCAELATRSAINGFFGAVIPLADDELRDQLGIDESREDGRP